MFKMTFREDPRSGQPRLFGDDNALPPRERQEIERVLRQKYSHLIDQGTSLIQFPSSIKSLPQPARYHARIENGSNSRCPSVILIHEALHTELQSQPKTGANQSWIEGFLTELRTLIEPRARGTLDSADRTGLGYALDELRGLSRERPQMLALMLLGGYLTIAERHCREQDDKQSALYGLAIRGLQRLFEGVIIEEDTSGALVEGPASVSLPKKVLNWLFGPPEESYS